MVVQAFRAQEGIGNHHFARTHRPAQTGLSTLAALGQSLVRHPALFRDLGQGDVLQAGLSDELRLRLREDPHPHRGHQQEIGTSLEAGVGVFLTPGS